jgi:2-dehydropantoate 2-reductase
MSVLVVGAGAAGGYLGAQLVAGGRDLTFLVHPRTQARLDADGLRIRHGSDITATAVNAVTVAGLRGAYDVVVVAVRTDAVASAIEDVRGAVAPGTRIVPLMNGINHLSMLTAAFGPEIVLGAAVKLGTSLLADGTIDEVVPGIQLELGQLDGAGSDALRRTVAQLDVDGVAITIRSDVVAAMWEKFAFITSTAVLTCLVGAPIGVTAQAAGGCDLARAVLAEVAAVAAAEGYALSDPALAVLDGVLTDPSSTFGPSMFRDLSAGRPVEVSVLSELADHARKHQIRTPLLDAAMVVIDVRGRQRCSGLAKS